MENKGEIILIDNPKALGELINVGTGTNHSVLDLVRLLGGDYRHIEARPGEARETLADTSKIRQLLDFVPQIKLENWIKANK